jgi:hypothetical protein
MDKKIYAVSLVYYTEENVPESGAVIFIRSEQDLTKVPKHVLKENIYVQEALEANGCEGIGNIFESSEDEFEFYKDDGADLIEF